MTSASMTEQTADLSEFCAELEALGRSERAHRGAHDVRVFRAIKRISQLGAWIGRVLLIVPHDPVSFVLGTLLLALHFALEAQLNHTVTHGAYAGIEGADDLRPDRYETLALPLQSATWRVAHKIHHAHPSLRDRDPDTMHPLFRVHESQRWRPWHLLNTVLGGLFVFECWGFDYDRFLKQRGLRARNDHSEWKKLARYTAFHYGLIPLLAGPFALRVIAGTFLASLIRNYIFVVLQIGSSVGEGISTWHHEPRARKLRGEWHRFQVETSKNYPVSEFWTLTTGGLDRHIEHHLWPDLPPNRLRALSPRVRALCERHGVRYTEYPSAWASYKESLLYLLRLSRP